MNQYLVMEIQQFADGKVSTPVYAYDTQAKAESKFHGILASAATSTIPTHTAILTTVDGFVLDAKCYKHGGDAE